MRTIETGVLVIGSGIAGLQAALEARRQGCPVVLTDKGPIGRSGCSILAEQVAAVLPDSAGRDSTSAHARDTLEAGRGLNDPALVEPMVEEARLHIDRLARDGVPFERGPDGRFLLAEMNGHRFPRSLFHGDRTGQSILRALGRQAGRSGVSCRPDTLVVSLLKQGQRVAGAFAVDFAAGEPVLFQASAVVVACGGAGRLYPVTTNPPQSTGDGYALALRAGAVLRDMEFVQFYPAVLIAPPGLHGLILGISQYGRWLDGRGEPFLTRHAQDERATRDRLSRAAAREILCGRATPHGGVYLDATGLEPAVYRSFRTALELCRRQGLELRREWAEVAPAAHYTVGGIRIDAGGRTDVPGLYAAGEAAGGAHGANRLGNNSLLDALVFGARAGAAAGRAARENGRDGGTADPEAASAEAARLTELLGRTGRTVSARVVRAGLQKIMERTAGILRDREGLEEGLAGIDRLGQMLEAEAGVPVGHLRFNRPLADFLETENLLLTARAVAMAALARRESRGTHAREDYPEQDDPRFRAAVTVRMEGGKPGLRLEPPWKGAAG